MYCRHCGASNAPGSRFCDSCGKPIGTSPYNNTPAPPHSMPLPAPSPYGAPAPYGAPPPAPKRKTGMVTGIIAGVVVLAGVGVGAFFLLRQPDKPVAASSTSVSAPPARTPAARTPASVPEPSSAPASVSMPDSVPASVPPVAQEPVFLPPQDVQVAVEDFGWYYDHEDSAGIPPDANVIGDDVSRLYGTWKCLIVAHYESEDDPAAYSCDIAPTDGADALLSLYLRGAVNENFEWEEFPGEYIGEASCTLENNMLHFDLQGVYMGMVCWEDGNRQYAVCNFQADGVDGTMLLMRDI